MKDLTNFLGLDAVPFLFDGIKSIAYRSGIFFGVLLALLAVIGLLSGFTESGKKSALLLLALYLMVIFISSLLIPALRIRAVKKLREEDFEKYKLFQNSNIKQKHQLLGMLI